MRIWRSTRPGAVATLFVLFLLVSGIAHLGPGPRVIEASPALGILTGEAAAADYWACCAYGNPGCCIFVLIELWWEGYIDFPL